MEYQLKVNDREAPYQVTLSQGEADSWLMEFDGQQRKVRCQRLGPHHLFAEIDGRGVHLFVASDRGVRQVLIDGVPYQVEDGAKRRSKGAGGATGDVTPPMPGTIMRVLVKEGDAVTEGQELLVMSAMKMETTLYAPKAAIVARVLVADGDQVTAGQQLFAWAPQASGPTTNEEAV